MHTHANAGSDNAKAMKLETRMTKLSQLYNCILLIM